jgi:hypothetical protein
MLLGSFIASSLEKLSKENDKKEENKQSSKHG